MIASVNIQAARYRNTMPSAYTKFSPCRESTHEFRQASSRPGSLKRDSDSVVSGGAASDNSDKDGDGLRADERARK